MPQWGDTGDGLDDVKPCFDIYMLGKLLWCMVFGRLRLPREYHILALSDLLIAASPRWKLGTASRPPMCATS